MRLFIVILGLSLLTGWLSAQQSIAVTPQNLDGWTIVGADAKSMASQAELTLPAGAQLARSFAVAGLGLQLKTRPTLGLNEADWPVVELGSSALVLSRNGSVGRLLLSVDGAAPQSPPFEFALDGAGRSKDLLTITVSSNGATLNVAIAGESLEFAVKQGRPSALEIVISAGGAQDWLIQSLLVTTNPADLVKAPAGISASSLTPSVANSDRSSGLATSASFFQRDSSAALAVNPVNSASTPAPTPLSRATAAPLATLEVFTPPAVRRGRVDVIRGSVPVFKN